MNNTPLLEIRDLTKTFPIRGTRRHMTAVDHVSFAIPAGTSLGLIGESGSGKTTIGRMILGLTRPADGQILYDGVDITQKPMSDYRQKIQYIAQNPSGSLDPKFTIYDSVAEGIRANHLASSKKTEAEKVLSLLHRVGLSDSDAAKYPHEFSGGQLQRIVIARALAVDPDFLVLDEPVSALDVSYQAQILNLLEEIKQERGLTTLFISHDLSVVQGFCDTIAVMYMGHLVEIGRAEAIALHAAHPYTQALLNAIPVADPLIARRKPSVPIRVALSDISGGCSFYSRCPRAKEGCRKSPPALREIPASQETEGIHAASCHFPDTTK